ncbi:MAG: hypothetical protein JO107_05020 [Hyphomicrobiales bacterium]|nr:hypothetical protein [Hyphomicrobiales bacterium]
MNAHEHGSPENGNGAAAKPDAAGENPAHPAETLGAAQSLDESRADAPEIEPARLNLIPYLASPQAGATGLGMTRWLSGVAAGLALIAAVTAVGLYDHARQAGLLAGKAQESADLAQSVKSLKERLDAVEATRSRDESADFRKIAAEIKGQRDAAHDLSGALTQLTARVDRVDHDQSARLDKLADRIDHDASARMADLAARIDKLEKRPVAVVAAAAPPPAPTPAPKPAAVQSPTPAPAAKPETLVSNETTGSIDKSHQTLRNYWLLDVQGNYALVGGRDGPQQVTAGDFLPGAGRVLRIERHGRDWVLVTSGGQIASNDPPRF